MILVTAVLSRILGLIRESLIAYFFGAQVITDSYVVASVLPTSIAGLLGGALTTVFISVFVEERERLGEAKAWEGARSVLGSSFLFLVLILGIAYGLVPFFLKAIAPGFDPQRFGLALRFSYIMLPSLLLLGLLGLLTGLFQSYRLFSIPALTGLLFNVCLIGFLLIAPRAPWVSLGVGTVVAAASQVLVLLSLAKHRWPSFGLGFAFGHPTSLRVWKLFAPILLGSGISYINLIVDRIFASFLPVGAVAALNFAARVKDLPLGLFGMAISQAVYPVLSLHSARGDKAQLKNSFSQALEVTLFFVVPASFGFIMLGRETIAFLFERGAFTPTVTTITSEALLFYSLGLMALCSANLAAKVFYAEKDTKTPVKAATVGLLANIVLNWALIHPLAHKGLALATSMSAVLNAGLLIIVLRKRLGGIGGGELLKNLVKIMAASGGMALVLLPLRRMAEVWWGYLSVVAIGVVAYGAFALLLRPRCVTVIFELTKKELALQLRKH
ncbi:MAG: murein biosynthesis integral membrane protein MurJ [Thermofilaceae archaeon]